MYYLTVRITWFSFQKTIFSNKNSKYNLSNATIFNAFRFKWYHYITAQFLLGVVPKNVLTFLPEGQSQQVQISGWYYSLPSPQHIEHDILLVVKFIRILPSPYMCIVHLRKIGCVSLCFDKFLCTFLLSPENQNNISFLSSHLTHTARRTFLIYFLNVPQQRHFQPKSMALALNSPLKLMFLYIFLNYIIYSVLSNVSKTVGRLVPKLLVAFFVQILLFFNRSD